MPNYAIYLTANNRVVDYVTSSPHDPTYPVGVGQAAVREPNVGALQGIPIRYWKHLAGSIVEMSQVEKDALDAEVVITLRDNTRLAGKNIIDAQTAIGIIERAVADITRDEINNIRQWIMSFKAEVALASTFANLKVRVATLPDMPDRTLAQLRAAIKSRIDSGTIDS